MKPSISTPEPELKATKDAAAPNANPLFPPEWAGMETTIRLPSYPWPAGVNITSVA